ncbi:MAG: hypothetical protein R2827_01370 [Bdellovibrionales bacterium]
MSTGFDSENEPTSGETSEINTPQAEPPIQYNSAEEAFIAGVNFYQNQAFPKAVAAFQQAYQLQPNNKLAAYNWAFRPLK